MEYESSATKLDIRFVPDDITFDEKPKDSADRMPDKDQYTPPEFVTTALTQSKVSCDVQCCILWQDFGLIDP